MDLVSDVMVAGMRARDVTVRVRARNVTVDVRSRNVTVRVRSRYMTVSVRSCNVTVDAMTRIVTVRRHRGTLVGSFCQLTSLACNSHCISC